MNLYPIPGGVEVVLASSDWKTNGHLIADVARLGYIRPDDAVCDLTYGRGTWWKVWRPDVLVTLDDEVDFRSTGFADDVFDVVTFDPPYKLNGRPDPKIDERYGVHERASTAERLDLMREGLHEAARITKSGGYVLAKCQDQVVSGAIVWQTHILHQAAHMVGMDQVDRFDMTGQHRKQPMEGRTQRHAHGRPSTLLVFQKR